MAASSAGSAGLGLIRDRNGARTLETLVRYRGAVPPICCSPPGPLSPHHCRNQTNPRARATAEG